MKLISFVVPSYNSEKYLNKCLDSLLEAGDDGEIIVVNDGSTDNTSKIAHEYQNKHPSIVKVVDKPNGGHGSGVNVGLANASGLYFKVVDSDDWLDNGALKILLETIRIHQKQQCLPDLYVANLVKERVEAGTQKVIKCKKFFPQNKNFGWNDVKKFGLMDFLIMHNMVYKTEILRNYGLVLPEHTFYVDNLVAYNPLPCVQTLHFLDVDLYRYYIGRSDQSVTAENITKRYRQQICVMKNMAFSHKYQDLKSLPKGLSRYMFHYLSLLMSLTVMFTTSGKDNREQRKADLKEMWASIKAADKKMYGFLKHRSITGAINWMPFAMQGKITWLCYKIVCRVLDYD